MAELSRFIIHCLSTYYLIEATALTLLPLGADPNASIYKVQASDQKAYFVKLKRDHFNEKIWAEKTVALMSSLRIGVI